MTPLRYLAFDHSEDTDDGCVFDAMASVGPTHRHTVQSEIAVVLAWAHQAFAGLQGPVEEGCEWDYDLRCCEESSTPHAMAYDERTGAFAVRPAPADPARWTFTLSLSGTRSFCAAFRERFGAALD